VRGRARTDVTMVWAHLILRPWRSTTPADEDGVPPGDTLLGAFEQKVLDSSREVPWGGEGGRDRHLVELGLGRNRGGEPHARDGCVSHGRCS